MKKKTVLIILMTILIVVLLGCKPASKTPPTPSITYTDEISYLPKHPSMKLKELHKGEAGNFDIIYYNIPRTEIQKFMTEYENILKQDGWTTTEDYKPANISVKKDDHIATIKLIDTGSEAVLIIGVK